MTEEEKKAIKLLEDVASDFTDTFGDDISPKTAKKIIDVINKQQKEIEELKKDNEEQWRHRCKMAIELDYNVVSKDKIRELINKRNAGIGYTSLECIEDIEKLLED